MSFYTYPKEYVMGSDGLQYVKTYKGLYKRFNHLGEEFDMFDPYGNPIYGFNWTGLKRRNNTPYGLLLIIGLGSLMFI